MKDVIMTLAVCVLVFAVAPWVVKVFAFYFDYFEWAIKG